MSRGMRKQQSWKFVLKWVAGNSISLSATTGSGLTRTSSARALVRGRVWGSPGWKNGCASQEDTW